MKKHLLGIFALLLLPLFLMGSVKTGEKDLRISFIYSVTAIVSLLVLLGYLFFVRKKNGWFVFLFSCVLVVNTGYFLLSVSTNLQMALWANRISYLGSCFLSPAMFMIILKITCTEYKKFLAQILLLVSFLVFLITASPGILNIYYKEVSFEIINGVGTLIKAYGPLHRLYLFYLLGYFLVMGYTIVRAYTKKTIDSVSHAVILIIAVFVNMAVWFFEQLASFDFEMLSVSYIISELFLLAFNYVILENQRLKSLLDKKQQNLSSLDNTIVTTAFTPESIDAFLNGLKTLTPTERSIYDMYVSGMTTKDVLRNLNIKENTLKFHNKNLYSKLSVTSRKQLIQIHIQTKKTENSILSK